MPNVFAIVPAAGQGTRIGDAVPKQYIPIAGRPLMSFAIQALAAVQRITCVCVVLSPHDKHWASLDHAADAAKIEPVFVGGDKRAQSVMNALKHLQPRLA
jgi:2-C-methyl-D-erythritol 4-phosphate cytidylyltransferase